MEKVQTQCFNVKFKFDEPAEWDMRIYRGDIPWFTLNSNQIKFCRKIDRLLALYEMDHSKELYHEINNTSNKLYIIFIEMVDFFHGLSSTCTNSYCKNLYQSSYYKFYGKSFN